MSIHHPGFLRAIIDSPEDDIPRVVYSDWLEEHGDPARAEFIRLQIELDSQQPDPDRAALLRRRETALLDEHATDWQQPFLPEQHPQFTRGFVSALTLSANDLLEHGEEYFATAPITRIVLTDNGEDPSLIASLGKCAFLRKVRALDLYSCPIGEDAGEILFASPHLADLEWLRLGEGDTTPEMVLVLAESLEKLRELYLWDFHSGELGDDGLSLLADSPAFASLTTLNLLQTGVGPEGARAVAESPYLHQLEALSFGFQACGYAPNYIGPTGIAHLASSPHLAGVRHLSLGLTQAGSAGVRALTRSTHLRSVESLDLGLNDIQDDGIAALAEWPTLANVTWLNLSSNGFSPAGATALARSPHVGKLETLSMSNDPIGFEGIRALADSPSLDSLRVLWLRGYDLDDKAIPILIGDNRFAQLDELSLRGAKPDHAKVLQDHFGDRVKV